MEKLLVELGEKSYNIHFTSDFSGLFNSLSQINAPKKLLIVTDTNVLKLYADEVESILLDAGYDTAVYAFNAGEENKSLKNTTSINLNKRIITSPVPL